MRKLKTLFVLSLLIFFVFINAGAQFTRYIVNFKDKGSNSYSLANPSAFLSQRAIDRRTRYQIAIDSSDLPITQTYLAQISAVPNVTILSSSKWLNQVSIQTTDANAITAINNLPFVKKVSGIAARILNARTNKDSTIESKVTGAINPTTAKTLNTDSNYFDYGSNSLNEMRLQHGEFLHNIGMRGDSMHIAVIDAGFYNYNVYPAFDSVNINGQISDTWDFVAGNASVTEDYPHGMYCLSTIAANIPGQFVGMAPKAKFYLYRSEDVYSEYPIEEHNWVCAAERADSIGADVISSSLGYATFDDPSLSHTYADLDGNTTMAARGADMAAKKGLLVFTGAGNSGSDAWHYILTPADADSVLTVGAVDTNGVRGSFSSYGPSADGRIKPDVMAVGVNAVIQTIWGVGMSNGTSYACPKMAGIGTCLWQAFPEFNNMKIIEAIKQSGSNFSSPNDSTGYGIPDMRLAFSKLLAAYATSQASINNCIINVNWNSKDVGGMKYEIEKKSGNDVDFIKVGEMNAVAGDILTPNSYQFNYNVDTATNTTIFWRIKQVIDTSTINYTTAYIDTSYVLANANCGTTTTIDSVDKITIAPNPVYASNLTLIVESKKAIPSLLIKIYDINGRLLVQQRESKIAGKSVYTIPVSKLARGKYSLSVYSGSKRFGTKQFLKL